MTKVLTTLAVFAAAIAGLFALSSSAPPAQKAKAVSDDGQAVLRFEVPAQNPQVGETFSVKVMLDTNAITATPTITAVELQISFDKDKVELISAEVGSDFDSLSPEPDETAITNANDEGKFPAGSTVITIASTDGLEAPSDTSYEVILLSFKAKAAGTANIAFVKDSTTVLDEQSNDVLGEVQDASVNIATAQPATTVPPTPQPTPSQVPTAGPEDTIAGSWLAAAVILLLSFAILRFHRAWKLSK